MTAAATAVETPSRQAPAALGTIPDSTAEVAAPAPTGAPADAAAVGDRPAEKPTRLDHWFAAHGTALLWVVPVMIVAGVVTALGLAAPLRTMQEALYTGYVWNLLSYGDLAPYTAWAQHPPLGWMQMSAYVEVSRAFDRWDLAVLAVRESMVLFSAATAAAAWLLARRIGLSRLAATLATLALAVSPFALAQHTAVSLENVATPWLVLAFLLATARRWQAVAFAAAAASFAVAVLSAETALVGLPFLIWVMLRTTRRGARLWPLVTAAVTLQIIGGAYLVIASQDPAALAPAVPVFAAVTGAPAAIGGWWSTDPVLLAVVAIGAAAGLGTRRLRPYAALTLAVLAVLAIPGITTADGFAALALPFGLIVVAGATEEAARLVRVRGAQRAVLPVVVVAAVALGVVVAVPVDSARIPAALSGRTDDPVVSAEAWLRDNVPQGDTVLVDTAGRVDFLRAGWSREEILDYDSTAGALPEDFTDAAWAIVPVSQADEASADSVVVASFDGIEVRRVLAGSVGEAIAAEGARAQLRADLGAELVQNPDLELADADRDLLAAGDVDDRIVSVLGALTVFGRIDVAGFPAVDGEHNAPRRQVALAAANGIALVEDGELTEAGRDVAAGLLDRYEPESTTIQGGLLVLRYPVTLGDPAE